MAASLRRRHDPVDVNEAGLRGEQRVSGLQVALVTELTGPADEGMRVWLQHYRTEMSRAGHAVHDFVLTSRPSTAVADPRVLDDIRRTKADVIQYVPYSGLTVPALARMRVLGVAAPRAHCSIVVLQSGTPGLAAPRGLLTDSAIFASQRLRTATGRIARRTAVVYPVVDDRRFTPGTEQERVAARKRFGVAGDRPLVLHVGHLKSSRNLSVLAELARGGRVEVLMVASTSTEPEPDVRAALEAAGVRVLREFLPDVQDVYRAADVYVFPVENALGSIEVPLSVVEARGTGLPAVVTRFGALPELFPDGSPGITYAGAPEMAQAVSDVALASPARQRSDEELAAFRPERFVSAVESAVAPAPRKAASIAISGVDGAGKSTQIDRLVAALEADGLQVETVWCRWDPLVAKPAVLLLGRLTRRSREAPDERPQTAQVSVNAEQRRSLRRRLLAIPAIRAGWRALMVLDYGVRLAPKVRAALRRNDVVLLDRYWPDVMVDFSYGEALQPPPSALVRLLPDPDGMVLLDLPADVAFARKDDAPDLAYLRERRRLYAEVAEQHGAAVVDASRPVDDVFEDLHKQVRAVTMPLVTREATR